VEELDELTGTVDSYVLVYVILPSATETLETRSPEPLITILPFGFDVALYSEVKAVTAPLTYPEVATTPSFAAKTGEVIVKIDKIQNTFFMIQTKYFLLY